MPELNDLIGYVPDHLLDKPGGVFYAGRAAFSGRKLVYLLGLNPGGSETNTLRNQISVRSKDPNSRWSEYVNETWREEKPGGKKLLPGEHVMQKRIRHLLKNIGLKPEETPASNLVFVRTRNEAGVRSELNELIEACWPFHRAVIEGLGVKVVICLGATAGWWLRHKLLAEATPFATFTEDNNRRWNSDAYRLPSGGAVITLTHPSRAHWCDKKCDPSGMVLEALKYVGI
jgi:hypothetical protein